MKKEKIKDFIITVLTPVILGALIGIIINGSVKDYTVINKPTLSPPGYIFPIVWTVLYILIGISYYLVKDNKETKKIYYVGLIVNLLWSVIFFNFKLYLISFLWILLLIFIVIKTMITFYKYNKTSTYLLIPYLLWIIFASYLNLQVYLLN